MAYVQTSLSGTARDLAHFGRKPWALGTNILKRRHSSEATAWSVTGSYLDPDLGNDSLYPPSALWNGNLYEYTQPLEAQWSGESVLYILFRLDPGETFEHLANAAMVRFTNGDSFAPAGSGADFTVALQAADDHEFTTNLVTFGVLGMPRTNAKAIIPRTVATGSGAWVQYTQLEFVRLRITCVHGNFLEAPQVSELVIGNRRQFAHNPRMPYDPFPYVSATDDFVAKSGAVGRNIEFERLARFPLRFRAHSNNTYGLDEEAEFRGLLNDTRGLTRPFLYVDRVIRTDFGSRDSGYWGYCPTPAMPNRYTTPAATEVDFEFHELPPGQAATEDFTAT